VVLQVFTDADALVRWMRGKTRRKQVGGLSHEEAALLHFLEAV